MPDRRRHRGAHPDDDSLFGPVALPALRAAVADLSWLLGRGYPRDAALQLVGNRHGLGARQRIAVRRMACDDRQRDRRLAHRVEAGGGAELLVDGFNLIVTVEAAYGGGVLLRGRDGALRDMASMHGSYRKVAETERAAHAIAASVHRLGLGGARWLLDAPVSNSGRLRALLLDVAASCHCDWRVDVVADPDPLLIAETEAVVVSSDAGVLDGCRRWFDLAGATVAGAVPEAWIVSP